jgi:hypothetical protein
MPMPVPVPVPVPMPVPVPVLARCGRMQFDHERLVVHHAAPDFLVHAERLTISAAAPKAVFR